MPYLMKSSQMKSPTSSPVFVGIALASTYFVKYQMAVAIYFNPWYSFSGPIRSTPIKEPFHIMAFHSRDGEHMENIKSMPCHNKFTNWDMYY